MHPNSGTYPPLNTLKPVAENVWIVDGPMIRFGMPWPKMPFPTRMTVVRLDGGALFVHSPTPLVETLRAEIDAVGAVRHLIGPNRLHYWWIPEWRQAYPESRTWLAPNTAKQAGDRIDFPTAALEADSGYPWHDEIGTLAAGGGFLTEIVFFHHASRTLILTDLIENFEPHKLGFLMRMLTRIGAVSDPDGQMPRDMRLTFRDHRPALRAAVERMIAWEPERVVLAHGRWYESNGKAELQRAFRWLL